MYIAAFDRSVQSFCVKVLTVDGECIHLKNGMCYQSKKQGLTVSGFSLVYME